MFPDKMNGRAAVDSQEDQDPADDATNCVESKGAKILVVQKRRSREGYDKVEEPIETCDTPHANVANIYRQHLGGIDEWHWSFAW